MPFLDQQAVCEVGTHLMTARASGTMSSCGTGARVCQADQHQGKVPGRKPSLLRTHTRRVALMVRMAVSTFASRTAAVSMLSTYAAVSERCV